MKKPTRGRPFNKSPSEQVNLRWPKRIAAWLRKNGSKQKVIEFVEEEIKKK